MPGGPITQAEIPIPDPKIIKDSGLYIEVHNGVRFSIAKERAQAYADCNNCRVIMKCRGHEYHYLPDPEIVKDLTEVS